MRYFAYPKLCPSRWAGCELMPEGWEVRRLKFVATCNDEALPETTEPDYEMAYVDISSVDLVEGIKTTETLPFEEAPSRARRIVRDGDTIISTVRTYLKAIAPINDPPENMIVSTGFTVVRPLELIVCRFLGYALQSAGFIGDVVANSTGVSYPAINPTTLATLPVGFPTDEKEQHQIAAFLDWKTGQIDALIARKKELLEKLKEKRLAVITQAVTRGLDPAVPLRDSGIPWLGQVPEHWEVKRLRRFVDSIEQGWSPDCDNRVAAADEWGVVKAGCCNGGSFNPEDNKALPADLEPPDHLEIKAGDLLMSRASGSEELIGSVALVAPGTRGKLLLSDKTYRLRYDRSVLAAFLRHTLQSPITRFQIQATISGAIGLARNIAQSDVKNLAFAIPPIREQSVIVEFLDREAGKIEALTERVRAAIARLTEYRTALITAATTGKIDVRGVKVPHSTA